MTIARKYLVDPNNPLFYHLVSRCVRRAWLCGLDQRTRRNYNHRKDWLLAQLKQMAEAFAVDVYSYAIMSNHFHLVVYYDPNASARWSQEEVVDRWLRVTPSKRRDGSVDEGMQELRREALLADPDEVAILRTKLGSLSTFMKLFKQPISRRANLEDGCAGHFFEQRYYSGAIVSDEAVIAAMAYVDLNPVRAKMASSIAGIRHTAISARLHNTEDLEAYLAPVMSGLGEPGRVLLTLKEYVERLEALITPPAHWSETKLAKWRDQVATLKRRQRVFGSAEAIRAWIEARGFQLREVPMPE